MPTAIIVDDEHMVKCAIRKLMERNDCGFVCAGEARDGAEALALCRDRTPDLVITDICMPVMDGLELIAALKQFASPPKVVILSGYDEFEYAQKAIRLGVEDFLVKPLDPAAFLATLRRMAQAAEEEKQRRREKGRLFGESEQAAKKLADAVWSADMHSARSALDDVRAAWGVYSHDAGLLQELYVYLFYRVENELERRAGKPFPVMPEQHWPDRPESFHDFAESVVERLVERVRSSKNWSGSHNVARAVAYIREHYADGGLTLQKVSDTLGIHFTYLSRAFKEVTGVTFTHYLTELRLEKAKEHLFRANGKFYETADAVGYKDYAHFAKAFKKRFGCSPSEYVKMTNIPPS
jgi:two-component system response regulator YesN